MFCRKCGTKLAENTIFCTHCGERIVKVQEPQNDSSQHTQEPQWQEPTAQASQASQPSSEQPYSNVAPKNNNTLKIILSVIAVIIVLIAMHCMRNWAIWDVKDGVVSGTEDSGYDTLGEALKDRFKQMQWSSKKSRGTHYVTVRGIDRQYEASHQVVFYYDEISEVWYVYDWYINNESFLDTTEGLISSSEMSS